MRYRLRRGAAAVVVAAGLLASATALAALTHVRSLAGPIPSVFGLRLLPLGGTQALISAPYYCSGGTVCTGFAASGAAYRVDVTTGAILQTFLNPSPGTFDLFGFGSAAAGGRFFVSAMLDDADGGAENGGTVYVFDAASGALTGNVQRPVPLVQAYFGYALTSDATHVLVGAYEGGTVYLLDAATLAVTQTYADPNPVGTSKSFGTALAMDADTVVVGMQEGPVGSTPETGLWPGTVHVYERESGAWLYTLEPPPSVLGGFGMAVVIDGPRLVVSSNQAVCVYELASGILEQTIADPSPTPDGWFGISMAMLGNQIVVGAAGSPDGGKVHLIDRTTGAVTQTLGNPAPASAPGMGLSVAALGGSVLAGAGSIENPPPTVPGVFVFAPCGDGMDNPGEHCDDGNGASGDGCSSTCEAEAATTTTTTTSSPTTSSTALSTTTTSIPPSTNGVPLALALRAQIAAPGTAVVLDGSASLDPDGDALTHAWSFVRVPPGSGASLSGATTASPYFVPDELGTYTVQVVVNDGQIDSRPSVVVVTCTNDAGTISVAITEPAAGSVVPANRTSVHGTFQGPANTGISVNGVPAVVHDGTFVVNDVRLAPGPNMLRAEANVIGGLAAVDERIVTSDGGAPSLAIDVSPAVGVAPLTVRLRLAPNGPVAVASGTVDYGDGVTTSLVAGSDATRELEHTYFTPGWYVVAAEILDRDQTVWTAEAVVIVEDVVDLDGRLKGLWNGMNTALASGDPWAARLFLTVEAEHRFGPVFDVLLPHMPAIVASYSPIEGVSVRANVAEYGLMKTVGAEARVFLLYFVRERDGVWRLGGM